MFGGAVSVVIGKEFVILKDGHRAVLDAHGTCQGCEPVRTAVVTASFKLTGPANFDFGFVESPRQARLLVKKTLLYIISLKLKKLRKEIYHLFQTLNIYLGYTKLKLLLLLLTVRKTMILKKLKM